MAWIGKTYQYVVRNAQIFAGIGGAILVTTTALPQTVGVFHYRKVLARYDGLDEIPVDPNTQSIIDKCLHRLNLRAQLEANLSFFTTVYKDVIHKGSTNLRLGAIIGLPETFSLQKESDINRSSLQIDGQTITDWDSEAGKRLSESLVLSEKAKAFAIAREIKYCDSLLLSFDVILKAVFFIGAYSTGFYLNKGLQLRSRLTPWARGVAYSLIGGAWALFYIVIGDAYSCYQDNKVDREVARLTIAYAQGGVEFYNKLLLRNQSLRVLRGMGGASDNVNKYTIYGNEVETWRRSRVQISSRRDNLTRFLEEYQKNIKEQQIEQK